MENLIVNIEINVISPNTAVAIKMPTMVLRLI